MLCCLLSGLAHTSERERERERGAINAEREAWHMPYSQYAPVYALYRRSQVRYDVSREAAHALFSKK